MLSGARIRAETADRRRAIGHGGIGRVRQWAQATGLIEAIDRQVHGLKIQRPGHESDHGLNRVYHAICGGVQLEDIDLRRSDQVVRDAVGTERIPDPSTDSGFCPRFDEPQMRRLLALADEARLNVRAGQAKQSRAFLHAFIKIRSRMARCGRQWIDRILRYHPRLPGFFRLPAVLRC